MSALGELQRDFQRHVLSGDAAVVRHVNGTDEIPAITRLAVYCEAYRLRLIEALASNLPRLQQLLGEEGFAELALDYIGQYPSKFASIRWFGDQLAEHLGRSQASQPWLAELARWEWAIAAAFDARDARPIDLEALATIAPEDWATLAFELHPSVQRLDMRTNAPALSKSLTEEQPPPEPAVLAQSQPWLLWRRQFTPMYRSLEASEAAALDEVRRGGTFAAMCDTLCHWHEPDEVPAQAAAMLKRWVVEELITAAIVLDNP